MASARRDDNRSVVLQAVTDDSNLTPTQLLVDPTTKRLKVTATITSGAISSLNGLTATTQTFANDTNVTITSAVSTHTIGWDGQLSVLRGGTGANTLTGVLLGNATSPVTSIALSAVATQFLNGQGNFTTPAGTASSYTSQSFTAQTTVTVTHNFGAYPIVQVIDNTGAVLVPLTTVNNSINDFTVTFSASTSGIILASLGSPPAANLLVTAADYTIVAGDQIIEVTAYGKTITLPTAVGRSGKTYTIDNASAGTVTVATTSSQTIQGALTQALPSDSAMSVYSTGANWRIF
jgi:hypothetical protein